MGSSFLAHILHAPGCTEPGVLRPRRLPGAFPEPSRRERVPGIRAAAAAAVLGGRTPGWAMRLERKLLKFKCPVHYMVRIWNHEVLKRSLGSYNCQIVFDGSSSYAIGIMRNLTIQ